MIAKPVTLDSESDAYFIRDAKGKIIADNFADKSVAAEIVRALNGIEEAEKRLKMAHDKIREFMK